MGRPIDTDIANVRCSAANTAVPAEFAGCLAAERFIRNVGHNKRGRRRGIVLILVLVCLAVATMVSLIMIRQIGIERQADQGTQRRLQALWLAEAGVERAAARLAADPTYLGETWTIPPGELASGCRGAVTIQSETIPGRPGHHAIHVEADYCDVSAFHSRCVKQVIIDRDSISSDRSTNRSASNPPAQGRHL